MAFVERLFEQVKWSSPGTKVQGRLKRVSKRKYQDGIGLVYLVRRVDGVMVEFPGNTNVNNKLTAGDIGCSISVEYKGEDTTQQRAGQSAPKVFKVYVDESDRETSDPTQITDEDIPF